MPTLILIELYSYQVEAARRPQPCAEPRSVWCVSEYTGTTAEHLTGSISTRVGSPRCTGAPPLYAVYAAAPHATSEVQQ